MIVIDASAFAAYCLKEEGWEETHRALKGGAITIELALKETGNATLMALRSKRISETHAKTAFQVMMKLAGTVIELHPQTDLLPAAYELAMKRSITLYDALYIALAQKLGARLLSRDRMQLSVAKAEGVATTGS